MDLIFFSEAHEHIGRQCSYALPYFVLLNVNVLLQMTGQLIQKYIFTDHADMRINI